MLSGKSSHFNFGFYANSTAASQFAACCMRSPMWGWFVREGGCNVCRIQIAFWWAYYSSVGKWVCLEARNSEIKLPAGNLHMPLKATLGDCCGEALCSHCPVARSFEVESAGLSLWIQKCLLDGASCREDDRTDLPESVICLRQHFFLIELSLFWKGVTAYIPTPMVLSLVHLLMRYCWGSFVIVIILKDPWPHVCN